MILWQIGNTTVRTPYRLRDALCVLQHSSLNGNLGGKEQENAFASLLHESGVLVAPRIRAGKDASDLGRKWRVALSQLGFITPNVPSHLMKSAIEGCELSGRAYEITPSGRRLAASETIGVQQECFLRSLMSYRIPSVIENRYKGKSTVFSPLRFVLDSLVELGCQDLEQKLSFQEFALFVQTSSPDTGIESIVLEIGEFRTGLLKSTRRRQYAQEVYEEKSQLLELKKSTLDDYADLSFRYLKATGLFQAAGRGIVLSPMREKLAQFLREVDANAQSDESYLNSLWKGTDLPTDDIHYSHQLIADLVSKLKQHGIQRDVPSVAIAKQDLDRIRHELETLLSQINEREYAKQQATEVGNIVRLIDAIGANKPLVTLGDNSRFSIGKYEFPAHLEWIVWRAFLAIGNLVNEPWEARRFQIDQDYLPVHCAPGGGPDMIFEFLNTVVVVEVTLTRSSRQEAVEGEPVRRHVAKYVQEYEGKEVFGLFLAVEVDSNTANTFRNGHWFLNDDQKISLSIVPMTLSDFSRFIESGIGRLTEMPRLLKNMLVECRSRANEEAPDWKREISRIAAKYADDSRVELETV